MHNITKQDNKAIRQINKTHSPTTLGKKYPKKRSYCETPQEKPRPLKTTHKNLKPNIHTNQSLEDVKWFHRYTYFASVKHSITNNTQSNSPNLTLS